MYEKARAGENCEQLAAEYSSDTINGKLGGGLPYFGLEEMVKPFEDAAFSLLDTGAISTPIKTRFGYHVIKLLDRKEHESFEEMQRGLYNVMSRNEYNFDLFRTFDEKTREKHDYRFHQDAYDELAALCDISFPTDTTFQNQGYEKTHVLVHLDSLNFLQNEFVEYLRLHPFSTNTYSKDFMHEVFQLFLRDITTEMERRKLLQTDEYNQLMQEYSDGILLLEVSNDRIWS